LNHKEIRCSTPENVIEIQNKKNKFEDIRSLTGNAFMLNTNINGNNTDQIQACTSRIKGFVVNNTAIFSPKESLVG
tara:strand:- start:4378 stop:4605 length:228 start_codon:yes stop_codon:yes gene_type:complete